MLTECECWRCMILVLRYFGSQSFSDQRIGCTSHLVGSKKIQSNRDRGLATNPCSPNKIRSHRLPSCSEKVIICCGMRCKTCINPDSPEIQTIGELARLESGTVWHEAVAWTPLETNYELTTLLHRWAARSWQSAASGRHTTYICLYVLHVSDPYGATVEVPGLATRAG